MYGVLLAGLKLLETNASPKRVSRIFELKFLDAAGFNPSLDSCVECNATEEEDIYFNVAAGGVICHNCARKQKGSFGVSKGTMNFMRKIRDIPFSRTQQIKVSRDVGRDAEKILKNFIRYHIGAQIKSIAFIEELDKKGIFKRRPATASAPGEKNSEEIMTIEQVALKDIANLCKRRGFIFQDSEIMVVLVVCGIMDHSELS